MTDIKQDSLYHLSAALEYYLRNINLLNQTATFAYKTFIDEQDEASLRAISALKDMAVSEEANLVTYLESAIEHSQALLELVRDRQSSRKEKESES
jgi:hypothetical protein